MLAEILTKRRRAARGTNILGGEQGKTQPRTHAKGAGAHPPLVERKQWHPTPLEIRHRRRCWI
jgi:hypothetical protein